MSQNGTKLFMRIERNYQTRPVVNVEKSAKPTAPVPGPAVSAFEDSHRLNQALTSTPQVRSDEVARAKALLADPSYPSQQKLENIANLLARNWNRGNSAS